MQQFEAQDSLFPLQTDQSAKMPQLHNHNADLELFGFEQPLFLNSLSYDRGNGLFPEPEDCDDFLFRPQPLADSIDENSYAPPPSDKPSLKALKLEELSDDESVLPRQAPSAANELGLALDCEGKESEQSCTVGNKETTDEGNSVINSEL